MKVSGNVAIIGGVTALGALVFFTLRKDAGKAIDAVKENASLINPVSTDNAIYRGINAVGDVVSDGSDDDSWSLGSAAFEFLNPDIVAQENALLEESRGSTGGGG